MKKLVVLTGAGVSQESGIKTFRDSDGLWENYPVEDVASIQGWHKNKELMLRFYNERRAQLATVKPNRASGDPECGQSARKGWLYQYNTSPRRAHQSAWGR